MNIHGVYTQIVHRNEELVAQLPADHMTRYAAVPKTVMINPWNSNQRWIAIDSTYPAQIAERLETLRTRQHMVIDRLDSPEVRAGEVELRNHVVAYLLETYPEYFTLSRDVIFSRLTGLGVDIGPNGAEPMVAVALLASEDFLLLFPDEQNDNVYLKSGALLFPNEWSLRSHFRGVAGADETELYAAWKKSAKAARLGLTPAQIHESIVPHYVKHFAKHVDRFFRELEPDRKTWRRNWGLRLTDKLYLHPDSEWPVMPEMTPENWHEHGYMRSEHEVFSRLPESRAIVFAIKTFTWRFSDVLANPISRDALIVSNDNLSPEMVAYREKELTTFRPLLDQFRSVQP